MCLSILSQAMQRLGRQVWLRRSSRWRDIWSWNPISNRRKTRRGGIRLYSLKENVEDSNRESVISSCGDFSWLKPVTFTGQMSGETRPHFSLKAFSGLDNLQVRNDNRKETGLHTSWSSYQKAIGKDKSALKLTSTPETWFLRKRTFYIWINTSD